MQEMIDLKLLLMRMGSMLVAEHRFGPAHHREFPNTNPIETFTRWVNENPEAQSVLNHLGVEWPTTKEQNMKRDLHLSSKSPIPLGESYQEKNYGTQFTNVDTTELITEEKLLRFDFDYDEETKIFKYGGVYLFRMNDHWRIQVGGTDGVWVYIVDQSWSDVITLLRLFGYIPERTKNEIN